MSDDSTDFQQWDAAYVLGALSPQDRTRFAQYLAQNPNRAADIAELAGLPGILKSLSVDEAVALLRPINDSHREHRTHHAAALQRLARTVTRRRRRVRTSVITVAIVAAAALITGSLFIGKATIGEVGNAEHNLRSLGKAGASRWRGIRPTVRGVVMNPVDHPHGGGEGRTSGGRHPVSPWGTPTKGYKTRANKRTDGMIVRRRNKK